MKRWFRYLKAAFNARPFDMPLPPNWVGVAATLLLGLYVHPGLLVIGLGLEVAYLGVLLSNQRFRAIIDHQNEADQQSWRAERDKLMAQLPKAQRREQEALEAYCTLAAKRLAEAGRNTSQIDDLARLCWLHLRLLSSRLRIGEVANEGGAQARELQQQASRLEQRLEGDDVASRLRESLEEQLRVIRDRLTAHADAHHRLEIVEAELARIRQQAALVHERALLAADTEGVAQSVDVISASLNEAGRWLDEQEELFGGINRGTRMTPDASLFDLREHN